MRYERITCPRCSREVCIREHRYAVHSITRSSGIRCRMSDQLVPATGFTPEDFETRAAIVADLAWQVQDGDPMLTWDYLTAMPADEMQRVLMVALAGIPTDRKLSEIFDWVVQLPAAKATA